MMVTSRGSAAGQQMIWTSEEDLVVRAKVVQRQWKNDARVGGVAADGAVRARATLCFAVAHVVVIAHGRGAPLVFAHTQPHYLDILFKCNLILIGRLEEVSRCFY